MISGFLCRDLLKDELDTDVREMNGLKDVELSLFRWNDIDRKELIMKIFFMIRRR